VNRAPRRRRKAGWGGQPTPEAGATEVRERVNGGTVTGLCRLRFRTPGNGFELAVPVDVPLADLLPAVLGYGGAELAEQGLEHAGWVLQRLGGAPLDEHRCAEELGLFDGEQLYLRPRREALPPVHFDDLVDGLSGALRERSDSWRPAVTHHLALALGLVAVAGAGVLLLLPGPVRLRDLTAGISGLFLLAGAGATARAVGDRAAGLALAAAAVPFLALAGVLAPTGPAGAGLDGARTLAGASAAAGAAVLALAVVACAAPLFLGLLVAALLAAVAGGLALAGLSMLQCAAVLAVLAVVFSALIPSAAFRLSGLRLPALPRNAEELQHHLEPFPAAEVLDRGQVADGFLTSFHLLFAVVTAGSLTVLARGHGWAPVCLAGALCLLLLLHARSLVGIAQRLPLLLVGSYGVALLVARGALAQGSGARLGVLAGLLLAAMALMIAAWTLPGRRMLPYWARAAEILHTLTAISLLPLAFFAVGAFGALRGMSG
jgi:type VII secretion integral membrane protein EccD